MVEERVLNELQEHTARLERQVRILRWACVLALTAGVLYATSGLGASGPREDRLGKVLRVRGLVVEDEQGRARILLGAPVPSVAERKRPEPATALVFLSENGADRVAVGFDPLSTKRISPGAGILVKDQEGIERGGFTVLENGRVVLGLDYPNGREGVTAFLDPKERHAGVMLGGDQGQTWERAGLVVSNKDGVALLKIADTNNSERVMLMVQGDSPAKFLLHDPKSKQLVDVLERIKP
jgi:hypothetical protein